MLNFNSEAFGRFLEVSYIKFLQGCDYLLPLNMLGVNYLNMPMICFMLIMRVCYKLIGLRGITQQTL